MMMTSSLHHIECAQCEETWVPEQREIAIEHGIDTLHDLKLVMVYVHTVESIRLVVDGVDPEDVMDDIEHQHDDIEPDDEYEDDDEQQFEGMLLAMPEPDRYDDGGECQLLVTLSPPSPLLFFGRALEAIGKIAPETAVVKSTFKGYEVWSRPEAQ